MEWGCDAELWAKVHSKGALLKLVLKGNEEYARKRIAKMRELIAADEAMDEKIALEKAKSAAQVRNKKRTPSCCLSFSIQTIAA